MTEKKRDSLTRYRQKRDFTKTKEPEGILQKKKGRRYLIQKHAATRLHYDFRLELDGVLKSWAVTRGPSYDPADKRLAVEVEDHPVAYGSFEGTIPKGQYGGGTVMLWDEGEWEPIGDPRKGLAKGKLEFKLHGKRLQGEWTLVRMHARPQDKGRNNWLLIKHHDDYVRAGDKDALLSQNATSVVSGRGMEEIAAAHDRVWNSKGAKEPGETVVKKAAAKKPSAARKSSPMPGFFPPELATLTDRMPQGKDWLHEIKFDGYRALAFIEDGHVQLFTRTGQDWTAKFKPIAAQLAKLPVQNAILDGEITVPDAQGISSFKNLQAALSEGKSENLQYYVFDLLHLDGEDWKKQPLLKRKNRLETLFSGQKPGGKIFYSEHFISTDNQFLQRACSLQLEGVISKRADSLYASGRGKAWLKTKCHKRQEFVIGGFSLSTHAQRGIRALLLGYYEEEKLVYAGKVGTGFDHEMLQLLYKKLNALKQKERPFESVTADARRGAVWVKPVVACEVEFTEWTSDGRLRHPSFQGLREDKPAKSIGRDVAVPLAKMKSEPVRKMTAQTKTSSSKTKKIEVSGIGISHPDRILYPGTSITKLQLAEYYIEVADALLPYVANRPLSMVRCPEGTGEPCFFQRHIAREQSPYLHDTGIEVKGRNETYLMIKDVKGLITLVQWGVIELHPWGCLADKPDVADRIIFDLDPDPSVPFASVIAGAREVRARMQELGLKSFVKTTGGKGLHVVIPLTRKYRWPAIKAFAKAIAYSMEHDDPKTYIAKSSKVERKGKIFVDYLRNDLTSTAIAPFSARAREGATVATPLFWEELKPSLKPAAFTIETVPKRLASLKTDPWAEFSKLKQGLTARYLKALKITPE